MEDEHDVYGGEIPVEVDMEGDMDHHHPDFVTSAADDNAIKELDEMKKKLKEMEDEAAALREMQAKVEKEMGSIQDPADGAYSQADREEVDSRSVYVGNYPPDVLFNLVSDWRWFQPLLAWPMATVYGDGRDPSPT